MEGVKEARIKINEDITLNVAVVHGGANITLRVKFSWATLQKNMGRAKKLFP
jgi:hypothetical protein